MDNYSQSFYAVTSANTSTSLVVNGASIICNVIIFDEGFARCHISPNGQSTGCITLTKPNFIDSAEPLVQSRKPRIIQYNQTASPSINGLPAYSIAVEAWDNSYTPENGDICQFLPALNPSDITMPYTFVNGVSPAHDANSSMVSEYQYHAEAIASDLVEASYKVKSLETVTGNVTAGSLLASDQAILSGLGMSATGYDVNIASGSARLHGNSFNYTGGNISALVDKKLSKAYLKLDSTTLLAYENSVAGNIDADYNPSGTTPLPSASINPWALTGTLTNNAVSGGVYGLSCVSNYAGWSRVNTSGSSAIGASFDIIARVVNNFLRIEIDFGTGSTREILTIYADRLLLESNQSIFSVDTSKFLHIRMVCRGDKSHIYLNGAIVLSSDSMLAGVQNKYRWGFYDYLNVLTNYTCEAKIAKIVTNNGLNGEYVPSFPVIDGVCLGSVVSVNSATVPSVGFLGQEKDIEIHNVVKGNLLSESQIDLKINENEATALDLKKISNPSCKYMSVSDVEINGINVNIANNTPVSGSLLGSIQVQSGLNTVTGTGTSFLSDFTVGDICTTAGGRSGRVKTIGSNTSMTVNTVFTANETGVQYHRGGVAPDTMYYIYLQNDKYYFSSISALHNNGIVPDLAGLPHQVNCAIYINSLSQVEMFSFLNGHMNYLNGGIQVLNEGTAITWAAIDMSNCMPKLSTRSKLFCLGGYLAGTAPRNLYLRANGSGLTNGTMAVLMVSAHNQASEHLEQETSANQSIDYYSLTYAVPWHINVTGYILDWD